jgi:superfamily II DNA or RNA helicase
VSLLSDFKWRAKYDSDRADLVKDFYEPALSSAVRYDRTTGYFSASVLTLAARGIEGLVRNQGRMRLVVGCTLDVPEVEAIERGRDLRDTVASHLLATPLLPESPTQTDALELLSWMVARGYLEVKVAIPCTPDRRPYPGTAIFHEKAGVVEDKTGDRLAFNGSVNETASGWAYNWESFHVFTSWKGEDALAHVDTEERGFQQLWNDKARRCLVVDVPSAVRDDLLKFLPPDDARPRRLQQVVDPDPESAVEEAETVEVVPPPVSNPADLRPLVWGVIQHAPTLPNGGERVGEATAIVTPWPHQVRAFERMYNRWPPRLLIADEVGLGKTIEVGLVVRQAILAGRARRVLVLAPKAVVRQWQIELREKFNLNWPIYDGQTLTWSSSPAHGGSRTVKIARAHWHREPFVITSSQLMRRTDRESELLVDAEPWDLVVLDEAHHARRKGAGLTKDRKPNQLLGLMQRLRERTAGLLLLTATPMQVHPLEVWELLRLLGLPDAWTESQFLAFFDRAAKGNPSHEEFEFLARMFQSTEATYGPADESVARRFMPRAGALASRQVMRALRDPAATARKRLETDRRKAAIKVMVATSPVARLTSRHTRELLRRYFEAGLISTPVPRRRVDDVFVDLSADERRVYESVEDYISTTYQQADPARKNAVGFVMTVYRRRLASSFLALRQTLAARLDDLRQPGRLTVEPDDVQEAEEGEDAPDADQAVHLSIDALEAEERGDLESLLTVVKKLPVDSKAGVLAGELRKLAADGYEQALVFTQYTDTLDFLREELVRAGLRVICFSGRGGERRGPGGQWTWVSREDAKRAFREKQADILLCTDAAAEGLNFQFCGALVNYDLPWNPMRVEQRIGRIDRLGQGFAEIRIINLHYRDTVEADVYVALRERINLFERFVGKLQPILAALPRRIQDAALASKAAREQSKAEAVSAVQTDVAEAESDPFDLDAITEDEVRDPVRAEPLYNLEDLDAVIKNSGLLPPGIDVSPLGTREYSYSQPGMSAPVRVTTSPAYFDEHPESVELWSPGSPIFPLPESVLPTEEVARRIAEFRILVSGSQDAT